MTDAELDEIEKKGAESTLTDHAKEVLGDCIKFIRRKNSEKFTDIVGKSIDIVAERGNA